jgi:AraC family transcriptional regulator
VVPAVAEPQLVWIVSGSALVEEREFGGKWSGRTVTAGEFFLTTTATPYELRWRVTSAENFETLVAYIGLPLFGRAHAEVSGTEAREPRLREVFGERDPILMALLHVLHAELISGRAASPMLVQGIAQSLAVHLMRTYPSPEADKQRQAGGLPAFKLHKVVRLLETHLDEELQLDRLAEEAGMSAFHFSRLFKKTTGFSPSQYLIRLRMAEARRLLRETERSVIEIGLEVGYSSPSHFAQIFRREVGITPTDYRGRQ